MDAVDWDEETGQETAFEISYEKPVEEFGYFGEDGELVPCPYEDTVFYYKEKWESWPGRRIWSNYNPVSLTSGIKIGAIMEMTEKQRELFN